MAQSGRNNCIVSACINVLLLFVCDCGGGLQEKVDGED